MAHLSLLQDMS